MNGDRLRIAFVADTLGGPIGGGVIAGRQVVEKLRERHEVVVVGADASGPGDAKLSGFQLPLRAMREMQFVMARPDRAVLARVCAEAEVVHLQFPFWLSFAALAEARAAGRPVVAAFHVQPENAAFNVGIRAMSLNRAVYRFWIERLYNQVDAVVCPTRFAERKLREHGLRSPVFVISNGVPPDLGESGAFQREPEHDGYFVILTVGRLAAEKRQDVLLEAVRRSRHKKRIKIVVAGAGPRQRALGRLAQRLPNGAEIGFLPRERLRRLFATADLLVHPSEVELEGIAVLEALSMGLPAIVADSSESAASELALGERFRFPAGDAGALAEKIDALIERPKLLFSAREAARQRVLELSFDGGVERLVGVYRRVVAGTL
jgi:1,2-diacylglycerol 3-alpha-glucosyltransferase